MTTKKFDSDFDERGLLPYPVIVAATKGDPDAMKIVLQNYDAQIAALSVRKYRDERGNTYFGIDEDIRDRSLPGQPSDQHHAGEQVSSLRATTAQNI